MPLGLTMAFVLVTTITIAIIAFVRRSRPHPRIPGLGALPGLWLLAGVVADFGLVTVHLASREVAPVAGWAATTAAVAALILGCAVARLSHPRWAWILWDGWLVGCGLLLFGWTALLATTPQWHSSLVGFDLAVLAAAVLMVPVARAAELGNLRRSLPGQWLLLGFQLLHLVGLALLLLASARGAEGFHAAGLLCLTAAYPLLLGSAIATGEAPPEPELEPGEPRAQIPLLLVATIAPLATLSLTIASERARTGSVFVLAAVAVLAVVIRQVLSVRSQQGQMSLLVWREAHYRTLVDRSTDVILICAANGNVEYASPAAKSVLGLDPSAVVGEKLSEVLGVPESQVREALANAAANPTPVVLDGNRSHRAGDVSLESVVSIVDGRVICNIRDVTERARLQARLRELAFDDPLTGLPNRGSITQQLADTVRHSRSAAKPAKPAVLFLDLDGFKKVNDAGGHAAGDAVLAEVGRRIRSVVPKNCFIGRLGGDEFVVVVPNVEAYPPGVLADKLVEVVRRPYYAAQTVFVIGASIGVAQLEGQESANTLLRNADLAVYQAKRLRRGWVEFHPEMHESAVARAALDAQLASALAEDRILLYYQPVIDLAGGRVVGAEALLRWKDEDGMVRGPEVMIEFAERTGLARELSMWVLDEALRQYACWVDEGLRIRIAVNLTASELPGPGIVTSIREALRRHGIPPNELALEITEQALVETGGEAGAVVSQLMQDGILVTIDDFGTGFSSLQYLIEMPVAALKIDRVFIDRLGRSAAADILVSEIIRLAGRLGLRVVAEGIETEDQRVRLLSHGAVMGQGFLFSPPIQPADLAAMAHRVGVTRITTPTPQDQSSESAPQDSAAQDSVLQDSAPQDSAPQDSAPQDSAPQDSAPQDSAPQDSALGVEPAPSGSGHPEQQELAQAVVKQQVPGRPA